MAKAQPQKDLENWGKQKWRTSDGKPSKGKKRYLPDKAWESLSASEKASTNKAKAKGNKKGKQHVKQPKKIAKKTAKYRYAKGGPVKTGIAKGCGAVMNDRRKVTKFY